MAERRALLNLLGPALLGLVAEVEPGESTECNVVFVADDEETDLVLRLQPLIAVEGGRAWVALDR